jgi:hypothetical protein
MALGKRKSKQDEMFIPTNKLATGPNHQFYAKFNEANSIEPGMPFPGGAVSLIKQQKAPGFA